MNDSFGLLVNDECLGRRGDNCCLLFLVTLCVHTLLPLLDYHYWSDGFRLADGGVPKFLSRHACLILDTGKVLNLLRLCCPNVSGSYSGWYSLLSVKRIASLSIFLSLSYFPPSLPYYQHHLCSGKHQLPQLSFSLSLKELTKTQARCEVRTHTVFP